MEEGGFPAALNEDPTTTTTATTTLTLVYTVSAQMAECTPPIYSAAVFW